jgi:hypothetical protein
MCLPASPKTSTTKSDAPFIASAWSPQSSVLLTSPWTAITLLNPIKRVYLRLYGCEAIDNAGPCRRLRIRNSKVVSELAFVFDPICR